MKTVSYALVPDAMPGLASVALYMFEFNIRSSIVLGVVGAGGIARAPAQRTRVILADEPVSSLDPSAAAKVLAALRAVASDDGIAVLCSLHQVGMVAGFADRVLGLRDGRIVLDMAGAGFDEGRHGEVYGERAHGAYPLP